MTRFRHLAAMTLAIAASATACSVLFSLDDYAGPGQLAPCGSCGADHCQCAPTAPSGFEYARLLAPASPQDGCPTGTVAGQAMGQGALDPGCSCKCGNPPPGGECALKLFAGSGCTGTPAQSIGPGACVAVTVSGAASAATLLSAGTPCTVSAEREPAQFGVPISACLDSSPGGDCGSESVCTAALEAPFDPAACIVATASAATSCPAGYPHKYVFATGIADSRTCDPAGCGCKPQKCPDAKVSLCQDAACQTCLKTAEPISTCANFGGLPFARLDNAGTTEGACQPEGQAITSGSVKATGSAMVCCHQTLAASADAGSTSP